MVQFEHYLISNSIGYVKMLTFWLGRLFRNSLAIDRVGSLKLTSSIYYSKKKKQGINGDVMFLTINIMLYMVSAFIGSSHTENS